MSGFLVYGTDVYAARRDLRGRIVTVLRGVTESRGLQLTDFRSRAAPTYVIHELMSTDEHAEPGDCVDRVALLGFFEVEAGASMLVGDEVWCGTTLLGTIAGFDETHMPNHQNILLNAAELKDGESLGLSVEDAVRFVRPEVAEGGEG